MESFSTTQKCCCCMKIPPRSSATNLASRDTPNRSKTTMAYLMMARCSRNPKIRWPVQDGRRFQSATRPDAVHCLRQHHQRAWSPIVSTMPLPLFVLVRTFRRERSSQRTGISFLPCSQPQYEVRCIFVLAIQVRVRSRDENVNPSPVMILVIETKTRNVMRMSFEFLTLLRR